MQCRRLNKTAAEATRQLENSERFFAARAEKLRPRVIVELM